MRRFFIKRVALALLTLFFIMTLTFVLMHAIPGDPFDAQNIQRAEIREAMYAKYGLDKPVFEQYVKYMTDFVRGDFGISYQKTDTSVNEIIATGAPYSMTIGICASVLIVVIGVTAGVVAALRHNRIADRTLMILATIGATIPSFVIASGFLYIFSSKLGWVPSFGVGTWKHYIGPVISVSVFSIAFISRLARTSVLEEMGKDYIRTARAKGTPEALVITRHALRNAMIPVVTYVGQMVAGIVTGSFVVEKVFGMPGIGYLFTESILNRDYTAIMGITVFFSVLLIISILIVDMLYVLIDPRIKYD